MSGNKQLQISPPLPLHVQPQPSSESGESMSNLPKVTKNFVLLLPLLVAPAYSSPHLMINWNNYADCTGKDYVYWRKNSYVLKNVHVLLVGTKEVQIQENFAGEAVELSTLSLLLSRNPGWGVTRSGHRWNIYRLYIPDKSSFQVSHISGLAFDVRFWPGNMK